MKEIKAPDPIDSARMHVFLAGSIEMGAAVKWQDQVSAALTQYNVTVLNPRRDDWDSSWVQSIDNAKFKEQVDWELTAMQLADTIAMYFDPETKSPITLLELGLYARTGKLIVCCPNGYWRKGNVDVVCSRYHVQQVNTIDDLIKAVEKKVRG
jgi:nucleoside 2-deoxyribosyltransferase